MSRYEHTRHANRGPGMAHEADEPDCNVPVDNDEWAGWLSEELHLLQIGA